MTRKVVRKEKLNSKSTYKNSKLKNKKKLSQNTPNSRANSSTTSDPNHTLPENNHLDSFDIFRSKEGQ